GAADRFPRLALYRAAGAGLLAGISDVRAALSALAALVERAVRRDLPRGGPAQPAGHHHRADYRLRAVAGAAATGAPARALANVGCRRDHDPADGAGAGRALAGEHPRPARLGHRISVRGRARTLAHAGAN